MNNEIIKVEIKPNFAGGYRAESDGKYISLYGKSLDFISFDMGGEDGDIKYEEVLLIPVVAERRSVHPEVIAVKDGFIHIELVSI